MKNNKTEEIEKKRKGNLNFDFKPRNWIFKFYQIYNIHNSCDL